MTPSGLGRNALDRSLPSLKGWRRDLFGDKALALKHGELMRTLEKNRVIAVERGV